MRKKKPASESAPEKAKTPSEFRLISDALRGLSRGDAEQYISARTRFAYLGKNRGIGIVLGQYKMFLDTTDQGIAPHMIFDGYWEYWLTRFIVDHIRPGDVVCDVGANLGYYSILMSELVGHAGRVHCFEPNPGMCELLRATLGTNGFASRATVHPVALSEAEKPAINFFIPHNEPKNAHAVPAGFTHPSGHTIMVPTRKLDSLEFPRLDFIKIDVEGAELAVLGGLQRLKETFRPRIVSEVNFGRGYTYDQIVDLLGYRGGLLHVDYTGKAAPLTREMSLRERINEDWLVFWPGE